MGVGEVFLFRANELEMLALMVGGGEVRYVE